MTSRRKADPEALEPRPDTAGRRTTAGLGLPVLGTAAPTGSGATHTAESASPDFTAENPPVVSFVSLGCAKNLVDSERMLGDLAGSGAVISGDEDAADTIVVNTCGFLESSRTEAMEIIAELAGRKRAGRLRRLVVAGCLVQRDGEKIRTAVPEVDALVGVNNREDVVRAVWRMDRDAAVDRYLGDYHPSQAARWHDTGRLRLTPQHYAYVRISEGCNQKCTFCTIPSIRGLMYSKPADRIVAESRELTADGARELLLIGQDTTSYGVDLDGGDSLAGLLRRLDAECEAARWIRLMYVYPSVMTDAIIDAIAESARIVKYIDIPLQHINDRMLRRMYRRVTRRQTERLLERLRSRIPDVTIRTTFIVGFPGETDAEFDELCAFVRDFGFDAVGAFRYSFEPETPSGRMKEQVPEAVKEERYEQLMLAQQDVAFAQARRWIGRELDVVVDEPADGGSVARHAGQAPEVDAVSLIPGGDHAPGTFLRARCIDTQDYDLIVEPVD